MSKEKLTRDSEIYDEAMRHKIINNSSFESEFVNTVSLDYRVSYKCDLWWKSLNKTYDFNDISIDRLVDLQSMGEVRLAEEAGKKRTSHTWRAKGRVDFKVYIQYKIKLPDSDKIVAETSLDLNSGKDKQRVQDLVSGIVNEESVDVTLKDGDVEVNTGSNVYKSELLDDFNHKSDERCNQLIDYLASDGVYAEGEIKDLSYGDDRIYVPVSMGETEVEFMFENPESNQDFWEIAELYGEGDPLLMSNSEVFICLSHLDNSSDCLMGDGLFTAHTEPKNGLLRNMLNLFSFERLRHKIRKTT